MPVDDARQPDGDWSQPRFRFKVQWGELEATFEEVVGLDVEALPIEYRHASGPAFADVKQPGMAMAADVFMKKGTFKADTAFWDWYDRVKNKAIPRTAVTVQLLDEDDRSVMSWKLKNAWPSRVGAAEESAGGDTVSVDRIEIAHDGMVIAAA